MALKYVAETMTTVPLISQVKMIPAFFFFLDSQCAFAKLSSTWALSFWLLKGNRLGKPEVNRQSCLSFFFLCSLHKQHRRAQWCGDALWADPAAEAGDKPCHPPASLPLWKNVDYWFTDEWRCSTKKKAQQEFTAQSMPGVPEGNQQLFSEDFSP